MLRPLKVFERIERRSSLQTEPLAEILDLELQLTSHSSVVGNLEKRMEFLVHILYIFKRRKGDILYLLRPPHIDTVPKLHGEGALSVTSGAPRLLKIRLRTLRKVVMHHEAHVRLVYSHAESVGAHHHPDRAAFPCSLTLRPRLTTKPGMVERCRNSLSHQERRKFLAFAPVAGIDYSRSRHTVADVQYLGIFILDLTYYVTEVRSLETTLEQQLLLETETLHDVLSD